MVNVPSSDKVHVIAAWIALKDKTQSNKSNIFFIVGKNKKGRRLSEILVLSKGTAKHRATDKFTEKPMP